jgi:hypothetical protein
MADTEVTDLAPTDQKTGDEAEKDTSLVDVNLEKPKDGSQPAKPEGTSLLDKKTGDEKPADAKAGDKPADKPAATVPEKYTDPKLPEGFTLNAEAKTKFDGLAKELGMTQEAYQKVFDVYGEQLAADVKTKVDQFNQTISGWKEETQKELGTDIDKTLALASKGIDKIFSDPADNKAFREMLSESATGLGNWKLMVKAFSFVGKAISEGTFVEGNPATGAKKSAEEVLYDHPDSIAARKQAAG